MKKFVFILTFLLPIQLLGQSSICKSDTTIKGQLINKLVHDGATSITIRKSDNKNSLKATRLCEHHYTTIDSLDKELTNDEITELLNCDNGTLVAVGFIIFCNRTGDKDQKVKRLNEIIQGKYRIITASCSDAISILPLGQYCIDLLTTENGLVRKRLKMDKSEIEKMTEEIKSQEKRYWTK